MLNENLLAKLKAALGSEDKKYSEGAYAEFKKDAFGENSSVTVAEVLDFLKDDQSLKENTEQADPEALLDFAKMCRAEAVRCALTQAKSKESSAAIIDLYARAYYYLEVAASHTEDVTSGENVKKLKCPEATCFL